MNRFYFDLTEANQSVSDSEGILLGELDEAELEAAGAIAIMLARNVPTAPRHEMAVLIRDAAKIPLARVSVTVVRERMS